MAHRIPEARPLAALALVVLVAGCTTRDGNGQAGTDTVTALPDDTARLSARQLATLPRYGVQRLTCQEVGNHLRSTGDTAVTRSIEISLEGDSLVVDPTKAVVRLGDSVRWSSDSLVWVASFKEMTPFQRTSLEVRGPGPGKSPPRAVTTVVSDDEAACGRYYYVVAAYVAGQPDRVYVSDPPTWVMQ